MSEVEYALVLQVVDSEQSERDAYVRFAHVGRVDGAFLTDLHTADTRPAELEALGMP